MTAHCGWCTFPSTGRIRPFRVHRPNWKAECVERCLLRLEGGKDCKVLPILTLKARGGNTPLPPRFFPAVHHHVLA